MTTNDDDARCAAQFRDFLAGFGLGTLVAGVVAVLYAPKSGVEARADLRHKAEEARDTLDHLLVDLRDRGTKLLDELKAAVEAGREAATATRKRLAKERNQE